MPFYVWLTIAVIFTIVEIFTAGFFYACFAVGALAAWFSSLFIGSGTWQILIFCIVSVVLIPISRVFARRVVDESVPQSGPEALIGLTGIVTETIKPLVDVGTVKVEGQDWRATASEEVETGSHIEVTGVKGAKLVVKVASKKA